MKNSLGDIVGFKPDVRQYRANDAFLLPDTRIGMEFEYEKVRDYNMRDAKDGVSKYWEVHADGSLKDAGVEFVFQQPMFGEDAYNAIKSLMTAAKANKWACTTRAGIHCHVDIRDLDPDQLLAMVMLYAIYEKPFFRWVGQGRDESIYCMPWYKAEEGVWGAVKVLTAARAEMLGKRDEGTRNAADRYERYSALNLASIAKFGSVEGRHLRTTHDIDRVMLFVNFLLGLKKGALWVPTSDGALVRDIEQIGAYEYGTRFFGERFLQNFAYREFNSDCKYYGIPLAKDIARNVLAVRGWKAGVMPKGKHPGFQKWLEKIGASKQKEEGPKPAKKDHPLEELLRGAAGLAPLGAAGQGLGNFRWEDFQNRMFAQARAQEFAFVDDPEHDPEGPPQRFVNVQIDRNGPPQIVIDDHDFPERNDGDEDEPIEDDWIDEEPEEEEDNNF